MGDVAGGALLLASATGCVCTVGSLILGLSMKPRLEELWTPPAELQGADREWLRRHLDLADAVVWQ